MELSAETNGLWSPDDVEIREDGFLWLKTKGECQEGEGEGEGEGDDSGDGDNRVDEEQPLLLYSTELLLKALYPRSKRQSIFTRRGYFDEIEIALQEKDEEEEKEEEKNDDEEDDDEQKNDDENADETEGDLPNLVEGLTVDDNDEPERQGEETGQDQEPEQDAEAEDEGPDPEPEPEPENVDVENLPDADESKDDNKDEGKKDDEGEPKRDEAKKEIKIPEKYKPYQSLKRSNNLANRMQSAILDIQYLRHRKKSDAKREHVSSETAKVRALEHQQQRLLAQTQNSGTTDEKNEVVGDSKDENNDVSNNNNDDDDEAPTPNIDPDQEKPSEGGEDAGGPAAAEEEDDGLVREPISMRFIRTINSIRALYPHLLPILNHPRRNDKKLVVKSSRWKDHRRKAMSWILGAEVFDMTTGKLCKNVHADAMRVLQGFINVDVAEKIANDPYGSMDYWSKFWIQHILERTRPDIPNPKFLLEPSEDVPDNAIDTARKCDSIHELDQSVEKDPRIQDKYRSAVVKLHQRLTKLLTNRFPGARVSIYGSCLSNLSLGAGADVDLSLSIPSAEEMKKDFQQGKLGAAAYDREMKRLVYQAYHKLNYLQKEFRDMQPITRARVPVVKGTYNFASNPYAQDGSLNFDICFSNDIAVANSNLLREYSIIDPKVRNLMMVVKRWAKEYNINSAKDNYVSSYAWMNLVIFYLQCIEFVPNLQSRDLMKSVGLEPNPRGNYWHSVNSLDTCNLQWKQISDTKAWERDQELQDLPVTILLYGFFEFYCFRFPAATFAAAIKHGKLSMTRLSFKKYHSFYCIEDPFETADSHCAHDLGSHAGEKGAREMIRFFRDAESHLRKVLCGKEETTRLWPEPPFVEPQPPRKNAKTPKFSSRFEHKSKKGQKQNSSKGGNADASAAAKKGTDEKHTANQNEKSKGNKGQGQQQHRRGRGGNNKNNPRPSQQQEQQQPHGQANGPNEGNTDNKQEGKQSTRRGKKSNPNNTGKRGKGNGGGGGNKPGPKSTPNEETAKKSAPGAGAGGGTS